MVLVGDNVVDRKTAELDISENRREPAAVLLPVFHHPGRHLRSAGVSVRFDCFPNRQRPKRLPPLGRVERAIGELGDTLLLAIPSLADVAGPEWFAVANAVHDGRNPVLLSAFPKAHG